LKLHSQGCPLRMHSQSNITQLAATPQLSNHWTGAKSSYVAPPDSSSGMQMVRRCKPATCMSFRSRVVSSLQLDNCTLTVRLRKLRGHLLALTAKRNRARFLNLALGAYSYVTITGLGTHGTREFAIHVVCWTTSSCFTVKSTQSTVSN
jgi:hypothetical protein